MMMTPPCLVQHSELSSARMHVPAPADSASMSAGYKYREVVRNRAERAELPGYECPDCTRFYDALLTWGAAPLPPPTCGHAAPGAHCKEF